MKENILCKNCGETVTAHLSDFYENDIVDYLEECGYTIDVVHDTFSRYNTKDLIDELEGRGFRVFQAGKNFETESIVQMHRIGDPKWEMAAVKLLYDLAGKIV